MHRRKFLLTYGPLVALLWLVGGYLLTTTVQRLWFPVVTDFVVEELARDDRGNHVIGGYFRKAPWATQTVCRFAYFRPEVHVGYGWQKVGINFPEHRRRGILTRPPGEHPFEGWRVMSGAFPEATAGRATIHHDCFNIPWFDIPLLRARSYVDLHLEASRDG